MTTSLPRQERDPNLWTVDKFHEFVLTRPNEERWQLVDGLALMMRPPSFLHQKLGRNLFLLLDKHSEARRPDLFVIYETGLEVPGREDFNPVPDLLVLPVDADFPRYADRFLLVAEIISPSNTAEMVDRKLELYRSHPENLYCLTVDQDSVHVALYARENGWGRVDLHALDDVLRLPAFGFKARLSEIYKGAPLAR